MSEVGLINRREIKDLIYIIRVIKAWDLLAEANNVE